MASDEGGPLVVVMEDIHWADEYSLQLLEYISRNLPKKVFLVCTFRPDEMKLDTISQLTEHPWTTHMALQSFTLENTRTLIQVTLSDKTEEGKKQLKSKFEPKALEANSNATS